MNKATSRGMVFLWILLGFIPKQVTLTLEAITPKTVLRWQLGELVSGIFWFGHYETLGKSIPV